MTESYCGANCNECGYGKSCGCPFGTGCFIAGYIRTGIPYRAGAGNNFRNTVL